MGQRLPTAVKEIRGTLRPCRVNLREPKPPRGCPVPPEHLSERARMAWQQIGALLDSSGVLTKADGFALEGLCSAYADLTEARARLAERGAKTYQSVTKTGGEIWRPYPEVAMVADADRRFRSWLASFGMTPGDRSKVAVIPTDEHPDPWSEL